MASIKTRAEKAVLGQVEKNIQWLEGEIQETCNLKFDLHSLESEVLENIKTEIFDLDITPKGKALIELGTNTETSPNSFAQLWVTYIIKKKLLKAVKYLEQQEQNCDSKLITWASCKLLTRKESTLDIDFRHLSICEKEDDPVFDNIERQLSLAKEVLFCSLERVESILSKIPPSDTEGVSAFIRDLSTLRLEHKDFESLLRLLWNSNEDEINEVLESKDLQEHPLFTAIDYYCKLLRRKQQLPADAQSRLNEPRSTN